LAPSQIEVRFLVRIAPASGRGSGFLSTVKSLNSSLGVQTRNPKWTSYGALEVDLFARSKNDIQLSLAALEPIGRIEFAKDLGGAPPYRSKQDAVAEARALFNTERYWESHEVLEGVWRTLKGEERLYLQGVILVCAAFVHHQKGEDDVAVGVLRRAERQLHLDRTDYYGIDAERLRASVLGVIENRRFKPFRI